MARKRSTKEDGFRLFRRENASGIESGPWWYDFRVKNKRFTRSTGMRDKGAARVDLCRPEVARYRVNWAGELADCLNRHNKQLESS